MTEKENTVESIHIQARLTDTEEKAFWQQFKQTNGLTENSETLRAIVNQLRALLSSPTLKTSMPQEIQEIFERCKKKGCLASPYFVAEAQKALCVFPFEGKEPKILHRPIPELKACSGAPILVSMARKRDLEQKFERETETLKAEAGKVPKLEVYGVALREMLTTKDRKHASENVHNTEEIYRLANLLDVGNKEKDKLTRQLQPLQGLLTEKGTLNSKVFEMGNSLVEANHKIATLETDNAYKDKVIENLSESELSKLNSELLKESDALHLELAEKSKVISDYELDIEKVEALNEVQQRKTTEVISETRKMLRELRQYCPRLQIINLDPTNHPMQTYILTVQKKIEQFEGYLKTMTPKDNLEGFI